MTSAQVSAAAPDQAVWDGVSNLLDHFAAVEPADEVFILYTPDAKDPAAWITAELFSRDIRPTLIGMAPVRDDTLEQRLRQALPAPEAVASRIVVFTVERDSMSHVLQLRRVLAPYPEHTWAMFRMINASAEFFERSMNVTPRLLSALNGALLNRMMPAERLHITSTSGTDLEVEIDSRRYRWLSNRGVWRPGAFLVLPPGEVSTFPARINGVLVADGAFNVTAYTRADARLADHPVSIEIEEGRVVNVTCESPEVDRLLRRCLAYDNGDRIGELGFGTNIGTPGFIPMNSHINERHPGVHLGLGQHGQLIDVAGYWSDIHLDLITSDAVIAVDGRTRIDSADLAGFRNETHPAPKAEGLHEEDIDGDCCGLISSEVARIRDEALRMRECS